MPKLVGTAGNDTLLAGTTYDELQGLGGDDRLVGDNGKESLIGGNGNDWLSGGNGKDQLNGGSGYDFHDGGDGIDTVDYAGSWGKVYVDLGTGKGSGAEAADDTYANIENVLGSAFDDRLTDNAGANRLTGGAGNDALNGADGNDILVGGAGADVLNGGAGDRDAADYQSAGAAVTVNLVTGGTGGEAAGDTYKGVEFVYGSGFDDVITGDDAINRLVGNAGNDALDGGKGNDYLVGGAGTDTLTGGIGDDVFVFDGSFGSDTITDFAAGLGRTDRIWITGSSFTSFADVQAHAVDAAGNAVISVDGLGTITLTGVSVASLQADDFIF